MSDWAAQEAEEILEIIRVSLAPDPELRAWFAVRLRIVHGRGIEEGIERLGKALNAQTESRAKAEEAVRPDKAKAQGMLPRGDGSRTADIADDAASRLADGRTSAATDEHGRDSPERRAPPKPKLVSIERDARQDVRDMLPADSEFGEAG